LEWNGEDLRQKSFLARRKILEKLVHDLVISSERCDEKSATKNDVLPSFKKTKLPLLLSERMQFNSWDAVAEERQRSREKRSEGLMLKKTHSPLMPCLPTPCEDMDDEVTCSPTTPLRCGKNKKMVNGSLSPLPRPILV